MVYEIVNLLIIQFTLPPHVQIIVYNTTYLM